MAFDEARFGLINWHRRRYCPKGFRPPRIVRRRYEWSWLYAAVEPENMSLLKLPSYSPELNPVERWFLEFRRILSNRMFESVEALQQALTKVLEPYWARPALLKRLTGYSWWVEALESL